MQYSKSEYEKIINEDGHWSAHNIFISDNFYTISDNIQNDEYKLFRVIQNVCDLTGKKLNELRVLDLACLEGMFGMEFARQGAEVTFLDAREVNLRKVDFVAKAIGVNNYKIVKDDVRAISVEKYGRFDVVLCFGIFYHLDKNDLFDFVKSMYEISTGIVFFDTQITESMSESFTVQNVEYFGERYREHRNDATEIDKKSDLWKSIDNTYSFKLTKSSLVRMCYHAGFTSAFESFLPYDKTKDSSRVSLIAIKGKPVQILSVPKLNSKDNYLAIEITKSAKLKEKLFFMKNDFIYKVKLNSPKFVRDIYKKYFKNEKFYKKTK